MKKLQIMLAFITLASIGAIGSSDAYAGPAFRTLTIPASTNYGTLWDSLGNGIGTLPFTFNPIPNLTSKAGYMITIFVDDSTGAADSVIFLLQRAVAGAAADIGITGTTNGPGATIDVAAGQWINVGARLGAISGAAAASSIAANMPLSKFIPADSLVAYPIIPGEAYRIACVGGKAATDHYNSGMIFNVYVDGAK